MNKRKKGDLDIILNLGRITDCSKCKMTTAKVFGCGEQWPRIAYCILTRWIKKNGKLHIRMSNELQRVDDQEGLYIQTCQQKVPQDQSMQSLYSLCYTRLSKIKPRIEERKLRRESAGT